MHPNTFLRTFWRTDFRPEVFVAMSFSGIYRDRFEEVIEPAVVAVKNAGRKLSANRVDLSRSGDSILTDIVDGISHAELVLADVSTMGHDSKTGAPYRNGNVLYEVGLALACRQPSEVLLLRDDTDPFLFDVSTVPHKKVDFSDKEKAKAEITSLLEERFTERALLNDARLLRAVSTLTAPERQILEAFAKYPPGNTFWLQKGNLATLAAIPRLLDKQLLVAVGITADGQGTFRWTRLGHVLAQNLPILAPTIGPSKEPQPVAESAPDENNAT